MAVQRNTHHECRPVRGDGPRTCPERPPRRRFREAALRLDPPEFVDLDSAQERQVIALLGDLLAAEGRERPGEPAHCQGA